MSGKTDLERANAMIVEMIQSITDTGVCSESTFSDLRDILAKNQNECTGDGSFDAKSWTVMKDFSDDVWRLLDLRDRIVTGP